MRVTFESAVTDSSHRRWILRTLVYHIYLWSRRGRWTVKFCIQCLGLQIWSGLLKLCRVSSEARRETECGNMSLKRHWKLHLPGLCEQPRSISILSNWSWRHHNNCGNYPGYSCMLCCAVCASSSRHGPRQKELCKARNKMVIFVSDFLPLHLVWVRNGRKEKEKARWSNRERYWEYSWLPV